jgi:uncharacterized protein (DUF3084 family)
MEKTWKKFMARQGYFFRKKMKQAKEIHKQAATLLDQLQNIKEHEKILQETNTKVMYEMGFLKGVIQGTNDTESQYEKRIEDLRSKFFETISQRNNAINERDKALNEQSIIINECNNISIERDTAINERDKALDEQNIIINERDDALIELHDAIDHKICAVNDRNKFQLNLYRALRDGTFRAKKRMFQKTISIKSIPVDPTHGTKRTLTTPPDSPRSSKRKKLDLLPSMNIGTLNTTIRFN